MATLLAAVMFFARRIKTATDGRAGAAFRASPSPRSSVRVPLEVSVVSVARLPYVQSPHAIGSPFASATRAPALRGVTVNPDSVPSADSRRQLAEPPESFLYPVAPNPNLVGSVMLKAVIGADGAVKQVEVLSGNRALALAAVRAVRTWRYNPYLVQGRPVEAETNVTISFQGDDAVSVILPHR
jgi:TonB family protein